MNMSNNNVSMKGWEKSLWWISTPLNTGNIAISVWNSKSNDHTIHNTTQRAIAPRRSSCLLSNILTRSSGYSLHESEPDVYDCWPNVDGNVNCCDAKVVVSKLQNSIAREMMCISLWVTVVRKTLLDEGKDSLLRSRISSMQKSMTRKNKRNEKKWKEMKRKGITQ